MLENGEICLTVQIYKILDFKIEMEGDQNSSLDDVDSEDSVDLGELKKKIELSNIQLLQLTYNDGTQSITYRQVHEHNQGSK